MQFPHTIIDLTHYLDEAIPSWDGSCGFTSNIILDYDQCTPPVPFRVQEIRMKAGIGTHIDAPAHCISGAAAVDQLSLHNLIAPCIVIDVSNRADEHYRVSMQDIEQFEKTHGILPPKSFVIVRTGWERFWNEPEKYRNNHIFPTISLEAAQLLLQRNIVGIGIDTLSPDRPKTGYPVHETLLKAGVYIIENVANSHALPPIGSSTIALPIKIRGGTEAPIRLIALL